MEQYEQAMATLSLTEFNSPGEDARPLRTLKKRCRF